MALRIIGVKEYVGKPGAFVAVDLDTLEVFEVTDIKRDDIINMKDGTLIDGITRLLPVLDSDLNLINNRKFVYVANCKSRDLIVVAEGSKLHYISLERFQYWVRDYAFFNVVVRNRKIYIANNAGYFLDAVDKMCEDFDDNATLEVDPVSEDEESLEFKNVSYEAYSRVCSDYERLFNRGVTLAGIDSEDRYALGNTAAECFKLALRNSEITDIPEFFEHFVKDFHPTYDIKCTDTEIYSLYDDNQPAVTCAYFCADSNIPWGKGAFVKHFINSNLSKLFTKTFFIATTELDSYGRHKLSYFYLRSANVRCNHLEFLDDVQCFQGWHQLSTEYICDAIPKRVRIFATDALEHVKYISDTLRIEDNVETVGAGAFNFSECEPIKYMYIGKRLNYLSRFSGWENNRNRYYISTGTKSPEVKSKRLGEGIADYNLADGAVVVVNNTKIVSNSMLIAVMAVNGTIYVPIDSRFAMRILAWYDNGKAGHRMCRVRGDGGVLRSEGLSLYTGNVEYTYVDPEDFLGETIRTKIQVDSTKQRWHTLNVGFIDNRNTGTPLMLGDFIKRRHANYRDLLQMRILKYAYGVCADTDDDEDAVVSEKRKRNEERDHRILINEVLKVKYPNVYMKVLKFYNVKSEDELSWRQRAMFLFCLYWCLAVVGSTRVGDGTQCYNELHSRIGTHLLASFAICHSCGIFREHQELYDNLRNAFTWDIFFGLSPFVKYENYYAGEGTKEFLSDEIQHGLQYIGELDCFRHVNDFDKHVQPFTKSFEEERFRYMSLNFLSAEESQKARFLSCMLDQFGTAETALEALKVFRYNKTLWCRHIGSKVYTGDGSYYLSVMSQYFKTMGNNEHLFDIGAAVLENHIVERDNLVLKAAKLEKVKAVDIDFTKLEQFGFTTNRELAFKPHEDNWWGTLLLPITGSANNEKVRSIYPKGWVDPFEHAGIKAHCSTLGDYAYVNYIADAFARRIHLLPTYTYRASLVDGVTVMLVLMNIHNPDLYSAVIDYLNEAYAIGDTRHVMMETKKPELVKIIGTTQTVVPSAYSNKPAKTGTITSAGLQLYYKSAGMFGDTSWEFGTWGGDPDNWKNFYTYDPLSASSDNDCAFVIARKFDTLPWSFQIPMMTYRTPIFTSPKQIAPLYQ